MIRMIVLIFAACLSTVGGVYGAVSWKSSAKPQGGGKDEPKLQVMKTRIVSVPMITGGEVLGYIVARLEFTVDSDVLKMTSAQPEGFVADEAFRVIYETAPNDLRTGKKQIIKVLAPEVTAGVNKRIGRELVKDVMIDTWTYLSKQDMMKNDGRSP